MKDAEFARMNALVSTSTRGLAGQTRLKLIRYAGA